MSRPGPINYDGGGASHSASKNMVAADLLVEERAEGGKELIHQVSEIS